MSKNIKLSLLIVLILIFVCTVVVIWNPVKDQKDANASLSSQNTVESVVTDSTSSLSITETSSESIDLDSSENSLLLENSVVFENSSFQTNSVSAESSVVTEISNLVPEDQPDAPDLNFEASGSSYDDIMVNVLTCLLAQDMASLSEYVGSSGFRLAPTGTFSEEDVILSAADLSNFFSLSAQRYGTYPGSGESIYLTPTEYYDRYLVPTEFDFSTATVSYNDAADINAVSGYVTDPKTVSYLYTPNVMEWKRLIAVYITEGNSDVLCGMIYQDVTTN